MKKEYTKKEKYPHLEGQIFNGIMLIEYIGSDKYGHNYWKCKCSCGNIFTMREDAVKRRKVTSCECAKHVKRKGKDEKNLIINAKPPQIDYAKVYYNNSDGFFIIDQTDVPKIETYYWFAHKRKQNGKVRIDPATRINGKLVYLSRFLKADELAKAPEGMLVDHLNGDPSDCRQSNLRLATYAENNCNKKSAKQGEIIEKDKKFIIVNFPRADTSKNTFNTFAEAEKYLYYLQDMHYGDFSYRKSQEKAEQNKSFAKHGLTWGSFPYNKIQELPAKNPLRIALDEFTSVYASGKVIPDVLDREFDNIAMEHEKEQAPE